MLAARQDDVVISRKYYMPRVTVCQAKNARNASQDSAAVGDVIFIVLAVNSKPAHARPARAAPSRYGPATRPSKAEDHASVGARA